tara:strand:- start:5373 stop:6116 length:744 start_codon:yes stop_codon:yes gene_type:complete
MLKKHISDLIFIKWFLFFISLIITFLVMHQLGFLTLILFNDISHISSLIIFIFFIFTLKVGMELFFIKDRYLNIELFLENLSANSKKDAAKNIFYFEKSNHHDDIVIAKYITSIITLVSNNKESKEARNSFENDLTAKLETGWFVVDLLLKLGLIGTVIGFIIMLSAITEIENFDFTLMNTLLQNMSDGMKVALYTTLTGLVTSILLSMQYKYLEVLVYKIFHICNTCIPFFDDELKKIYEDEKKIL